MDQTGLLNRFHTLFFEHLETHTAREFLRQLGLGLEKHPRALPGVENRVFGCASGDLGQFVLKFYRPGRWPEAVVREEVLLVQFLSEAGLSVPPPLLLAGCLLNSWHGVTCVAFRAVPAPAGTRADLVPAEISRVGELIGRLHRLIASRRFAHRSPFSPINLTSTSQHLLLGAIPVAFHQRLRRCVCALEASFLGYSRVPRQLIHGDLGCWNLMWANGVPWVIDFDDACIGSVIQELVYFADSVENPDLREDEVWEALLAGYTREIDFDPAWWSFREPIRALRQLSLLQWSVARSTDPRFVHFEPDYGSTTYWEIQLRRLERLVSAVARG